MYGLWPNSRQFLWNPYQLVGEGPRVPCKKCCKNIHWTLYPWGLLYRRGYRQEAQLLQTDSAMLHVTEYFAKSFKVIQGPSK